MYLTGNMKTLSAGTKILALRLPIDLWKAISAIAEEEGTNPSAWIRHQARLAARAKREKPQKAA